PNRYPVVGIQPDPRGGFYVANYDTVYHFSPLAAEGRSQWQNLPLSLTLQWPDRINTILRDPAGTLWIGTSTGLLRYSDGKITRLTTAEGLSDNGIISLLKDKADNLWVGTYVGGVCQLSSEQLVSITAANGTSELNIAIIAEGSNGKIYATTEIKGIYEVVDGKMVPLPGFQNSPFRSVGTRILRDSRGDWWLGTDEGLYRFNGPDLRISNGRKLTQTDGLPERPIPNGPGIYEDRKGNIWVSIDLNVYRLESGRNQAAIFQKLELPSTWQGLTLRMGSDRSGAVWLGGFNSIMRMTADKAELIDPMPGLPEARPRAFFQDSRGWFWIGLRFTGVALIKDPTSSPLKFINYSTTDGLSSDTVWSITEDNDGRMYFGTSKGLDQLDVTTGVMRHFTPADGLAGDTVNQCFKDGKGYIWIATTGGISRLDPHDEIMRAQPPPVYLSGIRTAGEELPIMETGAITVPAFTLSFAQNNLLIEYVGLSFQGSRQLRYQYKLEGTGGDWSPLTEQRSTNFAHLAPGSYKFLVRAVNQAGIASTTPASVEFKILPPVWQTTWFISLALLASGLLLYALYRYRVAQLIKVERVRTRIAKELHDDIGSNLSRIALLSEVVRQQVNHDASQITDRLALIANVSRESVDSMSDIVWAINPDKDHLHDLTERMRRVAGDTLSARNVDYRFNADDCGHDIRLDVDTRREIFLIFKESLNNVARHSRASSVDIDFRIDRGVLILQVSDNGNGFDINRIEAGNGLESMEQRAEKLGGDMTINSAPGKGTTVTLKVAVDRRFWFNG
ncbi:MAG TPA: two-component regulator propeller domain-containing protein, partial [Blastocatellia bacterium]|nr:two-component regulator propeller domain-containing protein [Blastocatellia bacterium]